MGLFAVFEQEINNPFDYEAGNCFARMHARHYYYALALEVVLKGGIGNAEEIYVVIG
jgi:hypothetical protein